MGDDKSYANSSATANSSMPRQQSRKICAKDKPRYKADVEGLTEDMAGVLSRD